MSTGATILLVEDDPNDADLAMRSLRKSGLPAVVVHVEDGEGALAYLAAEDGRRLPALVILDLNLPRLHGLDVLREIRAGQRTRVLPVVVLTSSREERDLAAAYAHGANSFVCKPIPPDEFAAAARDIGAYWLRRNEIPLP
jgi:two-component system response regulator